MEQIDLFIGLSIAHLILFSCAMVLVAKTSLATRKEKNRQFWFSLLLPVMGPLITIFIHWSDVVKPVKRKFPVSESSFDQPVSDLAYAAFVSDGFSSGHTASFGHSDCSTSTSDNCHS